MTIKAGASPVTLAQGSTLGLTVSGTLTVESGAVLDVSALGYAGSVTSTVAGGAPAGGAGSLSGSGGSHGGGGPGGGHAGPGRAGVGRGLPPPRGGGGGALGGTHTAGDGGPRG